MTTTKQAKQTKPKQNKNAYVLPRDATQSSRGRLLVFDENVADLVLDRLSNGESLRSICRDNNMPDGSTVRKWLARNPDFARQYAYARDEQADTLFDQTLDIADNIPKDATNEMIRRAQVQIDTRKWMAGKIRPKKYGDSLKQTDLDASHTVINQTVNIAKLDYDDRSALADMLKTISLPSAEYDDL
jgi:hypothetical protein